MITITCDCCERELTEDNLIMLGSKSKDLAYKNLTNGERTGGINKMGGHSDLHFCGKTCFVEYFFGKQTPIKPS